ncbi:hypothetical protein LTR64_004680 [Lithohypha guttulata]|uniref:uncharacterized protein n=1 Tax=Lithohypha guttulata TaxID=1690604 RepID=UPI002DDE18AE|nr:hypothetical protein LTR51_006023 [Lithohypha guttulata]
MVSPVSTRASAPNTPLERLQDVDPLEQRKDLQGPLLGERAEADGGPVAADMKLSFLLDSAIYHPLSQVDVPPQFRKPFMPPPQPGTTTAQALNQLNLLIGNCDFVGAAHYAAVCLSSGVVSATDHPVIFRLLSARFSCLELIGQVLLAAQEAKALEDLSSDFYYVIPEVSEAEIETHDGRRPLAKHIMPFDLRVQATRLQSVGFSDLRRGITALYELGLEIREHIASPYTSDSERRTWSERLASLNMHVVNSLIELGDIECAQRTLSHSKPADAVAQTYWAQQMVLMLIRLGQLKKAERYIDELEADEDIKQLLVSLVSIADGRLDDAAKRLENIAQQNPKSSMQALAKQNLSVVYLYLGRIDAASKLLDDLINDGYSSVSVTMNLATIFDLKSDRSRDLKVSLVNTIASSDSRKRAFTNADFKL